MQSRHATIHLHPLPKEGQGLVVTTSPKKHLRTVLDSSTLWLMSFCHSRWNKGTSTSLEHLSSPTRLRVSLPFMMSPIHPQRKQQFHFVSAEPVLASKCICAIGWVAVTQSALAGMEQQEDWVLIVISLAITYKDKKKGLQRLFFVLMTSWQYLRCRFMLSGRFRILRYPVLVISTALPNLTVSIFSRHALFWRAAFFLGHPHLIVPFVLRFWSKSPVGRIYKSASQIYMNFFSVLKQQKLKGD